MINPEPPSQGASRPVPRRARQKERPDLFEAPVLGPGKALASSERPNDVGGAPAEAGEVQQNMQDTNGLFWRCMS